MLHTPRILTTVFLISLACAGCGRDSARDAAPQEAPPPPAPRGPAWFSEVAASSGLDFRHETGAEGELHLPEIMGSGAALLDYDGDGDLDAYLINATKNLGQGPPVGGSVNRLYRQGADGTFEDVTEESGLGDPGYGMGVAVGDFDNDGHEDVFIANFGEDRLYRNLGNGRFEDVSEAAVAKVGGWSSSASFLDYDHDGVLDLYVVRYVDYDAEIRCLDFAGRHDYCGPTAFPGRADVLLHGEGDGTFRDVSRAAGISAVSHAGLGVVVRDFDADGWPDLYVANDADPNELWHNNGDGTFSEQALILGASVNALGQPEAGMGVLAADFDGDLDYDLFMTHLGDEKNTLYRNLGPGLGFEDASTEAGVAATSMALTGFGTAAMDLDLDGILDLAAVNGRVFRDEVIAGGPTAPWDAYAEPNLLYFGEGDGTFRPAPPQAGAFTDPVEVSRGLAVGDVDGDGDLDLLVTTGHGPVRLYRNEIPRRGSWLLVDAWDPRYRRRALGAEVIVHAGGKSWLRTVTADGSYQSSHDPRAHFGLGEADTVDSIEMHWPDGLRETFPGGAVDRVLRLDRGTGSTR